MEEIKCQRDIMKRERWRRRNVRQTASPPHRLVSFRRNLTKSSELELIEREIENRQQIFIFIQIFNFLVSFLLQSCSFFSLLWMPTSKIRVLNWIHKRRCKNSLSIVDGIHSANWDWNWNLHDLLQGAVVSDLFIRFSAFCCTNDNEVNQSDRKLK